jgi:glycyl-tRNA synthetase
MAEIEHFVNPEEKDHPKFDIVSGDCLPLFPQDNQLGDGKIISDKTLKTAVSDGTINNQTLAYFMARTYYISFHSFQSNTNTYRYIRLPHVDRNQKDSHSISSTSQE